MANFLQAGGHAAFTGGNNVFHEVEYTPTGIRVLDRLTFFELARANIMTTFTMDGYNTYGSFVTRLPHHWVFAGTGLTGGALFGNDSPIHCGTSMSRGASGFETDKIMPGVVVSDYLAKGNNAQGGAEMVFKNYPLGGWLFNASSLTFGAAAYDPVISTILINLITSGGG